MRPKHESAHQTVDAPRTQAGQSEVRLLHANGAGPGASTPPFDLRASLDLDRHQAAFDGIRSASLALRDAGQVTPGNPDLAAASAWVLRAMMHVQSAIRQIEGAVGL